MRKKYQRVVFLFTLSPQDSLSAVKEYIEANFKEFRTPSLLFWKVYYNAVCSYIDKNILD